MRISKKRRERGKARLGGDGGVIGSGSSNEISLSDSDITPSENPELDASS